MEQTGSGGEHPSPFVRGNGGGGSSSLFVDSHAGCWWMFVDIHCYLSIIGVG